jgi:hypothetical protein
MAEKKPLFCLSVQLPRSISLTALAEDEDDDEDEDEDEERDVDPEWGTPDG